MFHFLPIAIRYDGSRPIEGHGYQVHIGPMYSDARGTCTIRSTDPRVKPSLRFTTSPPTRTGGSGSRRSTLPATSSPAPPSRPTTPARSPRPGVESDAEILDWVRADAETALHPSCTARMGVDDASVLDPTTLGVHGTTGLRVADASARHIK